MESEASSDSDNMTTSSPQTVFESGKVRVTHKRAEDAELPYHLKKEEPPKEIEKKIEEKGESDVDDTSTAYPSQMSSYSAIRDFGSSLSSVPPSWSTFSMSSCAVPDADYDSRATSWKDTVSDFGSLLQSRSSIANESLDFVPRKFVPQKSESIEEYPENQKDLLQTPSKGSLQPSDSFEYANSEDKLRIRKMEEMWQSETPTIERKHPMLQRKLKEYLNKRSKDLPKWESKETDSEDSDSSEKGWSFIKDEKKLERDRTVLRRASKDECKPESGIKPQNVPKLSITKTEDRGSLSDSSPTSKSPSTIALKQRLSVDPTLRAPFTILPGIYTDQRDVAKRFGRMVEVFKKPGHHIGPAKNPDCLCDHCRAYFQNCGYRNRARSVGDPPVTPFVNWKNVKQSANIEENQTSDGIMYTDF